MNVAFLGRAQEHKNIKKFIEKFQDKSRLIDFSGKISISFLPTFLANCKMLIAVETGTVHIAHAAGCQTLCLCNGSFYGRFQPYNDDIIKYIYPPSFNKMLENNEDMTTFYNRNNTFKTNEIDVNTIIKELNLMINK